MNTAMRISWFLAGSLLVGCGGDDTPAAVAPTSRAPAVTPSASEPPRVERDSSGKVFACKIDKGSGRHGCEATKYGCRREGCTERASAWCFPAGHTDLDGNVLAHSNCVVERSECETWHAQRRDHPEPPTGPCALLAPREYIDIFAQARSAR